MAILANKRLVLGVTGSIAAYKSAELVRRLREAGAEVRCIMTEGAAAFITPLTLQALSGQRVHRHLLDPDAEAAMGHIELARWADAVLVAPASADFLARLAQGRADDLLGAVCLATTAPIAVAPAMNAEMWRHPAVQENVETLRRRGVQVFGPAEGVQACGELGPGRLLEPEDLVTLTTRLFESGLLAGLKVVVTAGPTWEALDPVRGLTNLSSGKMGYAVAQAAAEAGAQVILVSGPTALPDPPRVTCLRVESALQMYETVMAQIDGAQVFIAVAAVADYRPAQTASTKIKKEAERLTLELVRNPDILAAVAARQPRPYMVGFAAETERLEERAREKLLAKRLDLVAANLVGHGRGFGAETNRLLLVEPSGVRELPEAPKSTLARELIAHIAARLREQPTLARLRQSG